MIHGLLYLLLLTFFLSFPSAGQDTSANAAFGGSYASLGPEQKRLVDDWFRRFSAVVKKRVEPGDGYDKMPLSGKTTFNAVTHALVMTRLTDDADESLAQSAIDLVEKVDGVAGQIHGARGDEQFRLYVQMKPGAVALLNRSKEFRRTADNTVYHKGYPTCFRTKGVPSIQISLTRDAARANIDVDYHSSRFPLFLVNGHLTASNSDVRAGNNDTRHNDQWAGLQNWWRTLLGLPAADTQPTRMASGVFAQEPKYKGMKPAEAIFDFLNGWLVEQKPNESIAYIADEAFACLELGKRPNSDRGMAKFVVLENMLSANKQIGKAETLAKVSTGVAISGQRIRPLEQPHSVEFAMYDVREDLAEEFRCSNRLDSAQISAIATRSEDFGKYVAAIFRIHSTGNTVVSLWHKDQDYWKMISYEIDPEIDRSSIPKVDSGPPPVAQLDYVDGDKEMIKAASDFLNLWLIKKNVNGAFAYVAAECLPCAKFYQADNRSAGLRGDRLQELLKKGMTEAAASVGKVRRLDEAVVPPQVHHQDLKLVKHSDENAFVIASIPEHWGEAAQCDRRNAEGDVEFSPKAAAGYGKYYASGFSLNQGKTSPAVLWIVWRRVDRAWKAVSYILVTP